MLSPEVVVELLEFAVLMAFFFFLAKVVPVSFWLFAYGIPLTGCLAGWIMAEPLPGGRKPWPAAYPLGVLALLAAVGLTTYPWVFVGYITWQQWLILPGVSVASWLAGFVASKRHFRRSTQRLTS